MSEEGLVFDEARAVGRLMEFLAVPGVTGQERAIGQAVAGALAGAGVPKKAIAHDDAHTRIPLPTETGNLVVTLPGTRPDLPRLLFMTHLDTVPLCAGAVPVREGNTIRAKGPTALGGDNRTGVACLVTLAATLLEKKLPHPPLTLLFTVREESGLWGARFVDTAVLGKPAYAFNVDGGRPHEITVGATGAERWEAEVFGRAAHAGVHPERGVSAAVVTALALAEVYAGGWFGKVEKRGREGTSNVGTVGDAAGRCAGQATNVVTDYVKVTGESRSHDVTFGRAITAAYRAAFAHAAGQVKNTQGRAAKVKFSARRDYYPFRLRGNSPVVKHAEAAAVRAGLEPTLRVSNGGLDANWMTRHGIPAVTFGAGQREAHTQDEHVDVPDFLKGCRMALALATQPALEE